MRSAAFVLAALCSAAYALRVTDVQCPAKCASDLDCSLNGACDSGSGRCTCLPAWTGPCCTSLNLLPVTLANGPGVSACQG
jgi:hypothetical protein